MKADLGQLEQVIVNLAVTARDAMPNGGTLTVRTRNVDRADCAAFNYPALPTDDYVMHDVEDTGTGIPESALPSIFNRFYRVDKARSRQAGGAGLGLSIVHEMVGRNFGTIEVTSKVGEGSRFTVTFPSFGSGEEEDGDA